MIHGDVTYTDEALYADRLSVVYEDKALARETLDRARHCLRGPARRLALPALQAAKEHVQSRIGRHEATAPERKDKNM